MHLDLSKHSYLPPSLMPPIFYHFLGLVAMQTLVLPWSKWEQCHSPQQKQMGMMSLIATTHIQIRHTFTNNCSLASQQQQARTWIENIATRIQVSNPSSLNCICQINSCIKQSATPRIALVSKIYKQICTMFIFSLCVGDEVGCILKSKEGEGEA